MTSQKNTLQRLFAAFAFASVFASIAALTFAVDRAVAGGSFPWQAYGAITALYAALFVMHHLIEAAAARNAHRGLTDEEMMEMPQRLAAA
jgi:hypothetical protein